MGHVKVPIRGRLNLANEMRFINLMISGQMGCSNKAVALMTEGTTKQIQSDLSGPGFDLGTSRMRIQCVTTVPPRSIV